jgi:hypothetical protein
MWAQQFIAWNKRIIVNVVCGLFYDTVTMAGCNIIEKLDWKEYGRKRSPSNHDNIRLFDLSNRVKPRKTLFIIAGVQGDIRSE